MAVRISVFVLALFAGLLFVEFFQETSAAKLGNSEEQMEQIERIKRGLRGGDGTGTRRTGTGTRRTGYDISALVELLTALNESDIVPAFGTIIANAIADIIQAARG